MKSGTSADITGIWGSSENNIYAVGYKIDENNSKTGIILHYDGNKWIEKQAMMNYSFHYMGKFWK
ncbi:MAG: hypothetical protein GY795_26215 [Desulfobacterales bacterium]|nr:hypothetical protein [Desulfobacterales bacterium]